MLLNNFVIYKVLNLIFLMFICFNFYNLRFIVFNIKKKKFFKIDFFKIGIRIKYYWLIFIYKVMCLERVKNGI